MKPDKFKRGNFNARWQRASLILCFVFLVCTARAVDEFGDISVEPGAIYTGNTFHGYAELRVTVENHSHTKTHFITLTYPNRSYANGNSIGKLTRTAKLEPEAQVVVDLLQPPLPAQGDSVIGVEIDGHHEGEVHAPNANNHCSYYYGGYGSGGKNATVFLSRTLDYDAVEKVFNASSGGFTAAKAIGAPDASGGGWQPNAWMPDTRSRVRTNWLELDYATPQVVKKVIIRDPQMPSLSGALTLIGAAGTNLVEVALSSGHATSPGTGWDIEFEFPETTEAVKTVRLEFGKTPPHNISIDAVQIAGTTGAQWASDARASSDNSASAPSYSSPGSPADTVESLRSESAIADWSDNWLAYTPFDAIVLNGSDLTAMPPGVFAALTDYLHAGGTIVLLGKNDLPAAWHATSTKSMHEGAEHDVGFGSCFTFASENVGALNAQFISRLREVVRENSLYWQSLPDEGGANATLPVVDNLKIPTRGIVIIMLLFIIVIGPVNMIYLTRIKRRTWMLWTIPAISFATTLLVFAYSLLREGITPDTRIAGLTVLDQNTHRAATIGGEAFYCPLTPSGGLNFEYGTEATPLVHREFGSGASREVDWTTGQHFAHGWVSARVPAHFHLRKSETRRERIQVANENGKIFVVNSLGANIKKIYIADAEMDLYEADNVAAGEKGGLIPFNGQAVAKSGAKGLWRDEGFAASTRDVAEHFGYLQPNTYVAVLDSNPFLENGLGAASSAKRTKSSAVVFGILSADDKLGGAK
jgi:hypothetical protein